MRGAEHGLRSYEGVREEWVHMHEGVCEGQSAHASRVKGRERAGCGEVHVSAESVHVKWEGRRGPGARWALARFCEYTARVHSASRGRALACCASTTKQKNCYHHYLTTARLLLLHLAEGFRVASDLPPGDCVGVRSFGRV